MEINIKWNICRVCLQEEKNSSIEGTSDRSHQMKHLFSEDKTLALHIYELSGVSMKPDDSLPDKICQKCVTIINNAVQFRKTCRSSNVYLQSILERTKSASTLFKSEIPKCQVNDDDIEYDGMDTQASTVFEDDFQYIDLENQNNNVTTNHEKKEHASSQNDENISLQHRENEVEQRLSDNIQGYIVELEEVIDASEEVENQLSPQTTDDDTGEVNSQTQHISQGNIDDSNIKNSETSQLQKFYMNTILSKMENIKEESDNSSNYGNECELVENDNSDKNAVSIENNESFDNRDDTVSDEHIEYELIEEEVNIVEESDESLMVNLEEKINADESQAQVSSTVDTNDEIEFYAHNSDISNITSDTDERHLMNENFSNCNISSIKTYSKENNGTNLDANKIVKKSAHIPAYKRKGSIIKMKRNFFKSSAYAPCQLCFCEICGNQFPSKNLLNTHMKVHFQYKNHQCELCSKSFITACNLQAHMRIHTGEKPFECKYCERRFNDRSSNLRHERTHTNEKPFECYSCGKSFSLATTLQNHMKVHTNERSYRCEPCGKSFKLPHHLKTHQNTSLHRNVVEAETNES